MQFAYYNLLKHILYSWLSKHGIQTEIACCIAESVYNMMVPSVVGLALTFFCNESVSMVTPLKYAFSQTNAIAIENVLHIIDFPHNGSNQS